MATVYEATFNDWVDVLSFEIPLSPLGKKSVERSRTGHAYKNKDSREWERAAAACATAAAKAVHLEVLSCPLCVVIIAFKQRPKKYMGKRYPGAALLCPVKPDCDNVSKSVLDALKIASVVEDDCIVVREHIATCWTAKDREPSVLVKISIPADEWRRINEQRRNNG